MVGEIDKSYRTLELEPGASREQVKQAWRDLVKVWHPDRFPNDSKLQRKAQERVKDINAAYEILEKFLTSKATPPRSHSSSSPTPDHKQQQSRKRQEPNSKRTETPPPSTSEQTKSEPMESRTSAILAGVGVLVIFFLILANSMPNGPTVTNTLPTINAKATEASKEETGLSKIYKWAEAENAPRAEAEQREAEASKAAVMAMTDQETIEKPLEKTSQPLLRSWETPGSKPKSQRLADLYDAYLRDLITPAEFHRARAKIATEP